MNKHKRKAAADLETITGYAQDLMTATADFTGEKVDEARKRLQSALEDGKQTYGELRDHTLSTVRVADDFIYDNPYAALGVGVCIGVLIGFLFRGSRN